MTDTSDKNKNNGVLIIGGGQGGQAMLNMLMGENLFPVVGVVDPLSDAPAMQVARLHGIDTYPTLGRALEACDPCLAFNVTGNDTIDEELRARNHSGGAIGGTEARMIWDMVTRMQEMRRNLEFLAERDALTGAFNRRFLTDELRRGIRWYSRYETDYSGALIDIDDFKKINDTYGHQTGDEVIKVIVSGLQSQLRDTDILGRWGGEEFLVLMPHTDIKQAVSAARRWLETISAKPTMIGKGEAYCITFSGGVASLNQAWMKNGEEHAAITFFAKLDERLYRAKKAGKKRIECLDNS